MHHELDVLGLCSSLAAWLPWEAGASLPKSTHKQRDICYWGLHSSQRKMNWGAEKSRRRSGWGQEKVINHLSELYGFLMLNACGLTAPIFS